jgi:hypothetical protein
MYGVCEVFNDFGGGSGNCGGTGYHATRNWWNGQGWQDSPIATGPFASHFRAEKFVQEQHRLDGLRYFVYVENDPFGGQPPREV